MTTYAHINKIVLHVDKLLFVSRVQ